MIKIYCELKNNEICQKLLFDKGYFWWYNNSKTVHHDFKKNIIFYLDVDMSFAVSYDIIGDEIYYKDFFKREIRELKLKRICKD